LPVASNQVSAVELDGEAVLYNERTASLHVLNPTATIIWACCDGAGSIAEIAADVADAFALDRDAVVADVISTVRDFAALELLDAPAG